MNILIIHLYFSLLLVLITSSSIISISIPKIFKFASSLFLKNSSCVLVISVNFSIVILLLSLSWTSYQNLQIPFTFLVKKYTFPEFDIHLHENLKIIFRIFILIILLSDVSSSNNKFKSKSFIFTNSSTFDFFSKFGGKGLSLKFFF